MAISFAIYFLIYSPLFLMCGLRIRLNRSERLPAFQADPSCPRRDQPAERTHPLTSDFLSMRSQDGQQLSKGARDRGQATMERRTKRLHSISPRSILPVD